LDLVSHRLKEQKVKATYKLTYILLAIVMVVGNGIAFPETSILPQLPPRKISRTRLNGRRARKRKRSISRQRSSTNPIQLIRSNERNESKNKSGRMDFVWLAGIPNQTWAAD
jgi:hypothetical protein